MKYTHHLSSRALVAAALMIAGIFATSSGFAQQENDVNRPVDLPQDKFSIRFAEKLEWADLIKYYAERAGLSLQLIDSPPDGVFDYQSDREMNMQEALDLINQMLITNNRVLIRNRDLLLLYDLSRGIPEDIIETVAPENLDSRGRYEIVKSIFDIKTLSADDLEEQFGRYITEPHRSKFAIIPAANEMIVQETVMNLLEIRRALAKAIDNDENWDISSIDLNHVSHEEILAQLPLIGVNRDTLASADERFRISVDPMGGRLFCSGDAKTMRRFKRLVETIDVAPSAEDGVETGPAFVHGYPVRGDIELVFKVLNVILSGRPDVKLAFDEGEGKIILLGKQSAHDMVESTIEKVQGGSDKFAVIELVEFKPDDMVDTLRSLFHQTAGDEGTPGPVFHADKTNNRLAVRGTPQEVRLARQMIADLDVSQAIGSGPREPLRRIDMTSAELNSTLDFFEQMWPTLDLSNELIVERPGERPLQYDHKKRSFFELYRVPARKGTEDWVEPDDLESNTERPSPQSSIRPSAIFKFASLLPSAIRNEFSGVRVNQCALFGTPYRQDETTSENAPQIEAQLPEEEISVPGAPIRLHITDFGVILNSKDLDALDRIVSLMMGHLNAGSGFPNIVIFELRFRPADEAKSMLESYLGLSGGGGGGGNPLGSIIGGAMSNAMGGGAGNMVSSLMGGGSASSDGGIYEPEDPVSIVEDVARFTLAVSASARDMEMIRQLIDLIDQPELNQKPNPLGETHTIKMNYRDPTEIAGIIHTQLKDLLNSEGGDASQPQMDEQKMLQALMQGGGDGDKTVSKPPKGSLSVDTANQSLIFTGPSHIYDQVMLVVKLTDIPIAIPDEQMELVSMDGINPNLFIHGLEQALRGKIKIISADGTDSSGTAPTANANGGANRRGGTQGFDANAIQRMMQQQRRGGGRGGGGRGGGGRGGGGRGRGGGGRGGR